MFHACEIERVLISLPVEGQPNPTVEFFARRRASGPLRPLETDAEIYNF
jgi:hypothetical protein